MLSHTMTGSSSNGHHPQLETLPQSLDALRVATDDLVEVTRRADALVSSVTAALELIEVRVEQARARERRRDRRNRRRKHS